MTDRIRCKTEGCDDTILPETAARTGGVCMRCVNRKAHEDREEFIRKNRREVDPYEGLTDPVEIIGVLHTPRVHDPLIRYKPPPLTAAELYGALSPAQVARLMRHAADALRTGQRDYAHDIAKSLATLTTASLDEMLGVWVERLEFWPAVIFRGAGAPIRDGIIDHLRTADFDHDRSLSANHALSALAWIGDEVVQQAFRDWEKHPHAGASSCMSVPTHTHTWLDGSSTHRGGVS